MATASTPFVSRPRAAALPTLPGIPVLGNLMAFRRDRLALFDTAARLGPIVRVALGPVPLHVTTDADVAHEVLADQAASFRKSAALQSLLPLLGDGLLTAEGDVHRHHRKLLAPAFAPKRLAAYGEVMVAETRAQVARWNHGATIDLSREMMEMTLAIVGRTMFGADVRGDASAVAHGLELGMRATVANLTSPVRLGYRWPLPRHLQMRRAVAILDKVVYRLIAEGRARGTDRGDVLSLLLLARDEADGARLSDAQIRDEVMTLMLAGHETTANALTWAWYELGRHPAVRARLEDEVDRVLGGRPITTEDLPSLPYTAAVIDEAMRLHPPVYAIGREALYDVVIGGHRLPAHSIVAVYVRGLHRRADYYPEPLAFTPERMLPDVKKARPRDHFLPFGAGPRVCIGSHFALIEGQLALATMVQHVRVRSVASDVVPEPMVTLRPRGGMPAIVERRHA